jgi:hypothetical protein
MAAIRELPYSLGNDLQSHTSSLAFPVGWADAKVSFECPGEMTCICETDFSGDLGHSPGIQTQESLSFL